MDWCPELEIPSQHLQFSPQKPLGAIGGVHCTKDPEPTPLFSLYIYRALTYLQGKTIMLGIVLNQFNKKEYCIVYSIFAYPIAQKTNLRNHTEK